MKMKHFEFIQKLFCAHFHAPSHVHIWVHFSQFRCIEQFEFQFLSLMNQNVVRIQNLVDIVAQIVVVHAIFHFP